MNQSCELFYASGGHGGPYKNVKLAVEAAKRLLRGNKSEHSIEVRASDFKTVIQTITRETEGVAAKNDLIPTEYGIRSEFERMDSFQVRFCRMNSPFYKGERWTVRRQGSVLNKSGRWEFEPLPSSRDDAFYKRCRFNTLEQAESAFRKVKN